MVQNGKYGFLDPMTYSCLNLVTYYDLVMVICVGVMMIVVSFLAFSLSRGVFLKGYSYRFGKGCNWLEFCWTLFPGGILGALGYVSWENLYEMELTDSADYHVKVVGHQWYWEYEYFMSSQLKASDELNTSIKSRVPVSESCGAVFSAVGAESCFPFSVTGDSSLGDLHLNYDSYGVSMATVLDEAAGADDESMSVFWPFLGQGGVTQPMFVAVNKTTEVKVCTADVIHSWGVPALGVKMDAVPGRVNHLGVHPYSVGLAYGNCYELCGYGHSVMPICVAVVSKEAYHGILNSMLMGALEG
uniref:cytochrome c oxidase subunit II n=1 Tax=Bankia gouldi TaxID=300633 RepID=UPI0020292713|nr:cytochrome c oxidase subunit II [Bankia gouldi]UPX89062.1 cytochrome c oxidase subunit 2 [Bankia gouldi]